MLHDDAGPDTVGLTGSPSHVADPLPLPLDFEAFVLSHQEFFHFYAELHCGGRETAEAVVGAVFGEILSSWNDLLQEDELEERTLGVLHRHVTRRLARDGRDPAFIINGQIEKHLQAWRGSAELTQNSGGLYEAIAELSGRQYTVIFLRYVMGYPTKRIARYMGVDERTVNYHCRRAKERLARTLNVPTRAAVRQAKGEQPC